MCCVVYSLLFCYLSLMIYMIQKNFNQIFFKSVLTSLKRLGFLTLRLGLPVPNMSSRPVVLRTPAGVLTVSRLCNLLAAALLRLGGVGRCFRFCPLSRTTPTPSGFSARPTFPTGFLLAGGGACLLFLIAFAGTLL